MFIGEAQYIYPSKRVSNEGVDGHSIRPILVRSGEVLEDLAGVGKLIDADTLEAELLGGWPDYGVKGSVGLF